VHLAWLNEDQIAALIHEARAALREADGDLAHVVDTRAPARREHAPWLKRGDGGDGLGEGATEVVKAAIRGEEAAADALGADRAGRRVYCTTRRPVRGAPMFHADEVIA
jgi:hypothetical protein